MTKVNNNTMRDQYDGQYKTFCKKNSDYGNSFEESLDKHGIVAMTACWLKGVRAEDGEEEEVTHVYTFGQDDPKVKLDERQRIVDQREKYYQKIARFIRNAPNIAFADFERYFNTRADLHSYERQLIIEGVAEELDSQIDKELEKFKAQFMESLESNANSISIKQQGEIRLISNAMKGILSVLIPNVLAQRNPKYDLNDKLTQAKQRNECYKEIASLILSTPWLSFDGFSGYVDTFRELTPEEKQLIKERVATEIYAQTDKNPGGDEESEFRSKKFNIPTEEHKTENLTFKPQKEDEEEKEPLNEKMFKAFLWLFHPIIDKDYRGDDNDSDC